MATDVSVPSDPTGLSRRRIVQGALWATPALLIATAAPAAAASQPSLGQLLVPTPAGAQNTSVFTTSGVVTYGDDGETPADHPVSDVTVRIVLPYDRLASGNGSFTGTMWSFGGRVDDEVANTATFTYTYGTALSETNTVTSPLAVTLPKTSVLTEAIATWYASGTSNLQPVQALPAPVTIAAYSLLTFGSGPTAARDPENLGSWLGWIFGGARYLNIASTVRNYAGSPTFNTSPVYSLVAKITVPNNHVYGTGSPVAMSGPWSAPTSAVGATTTVFTFAHSSPPLAASLASTNGNFRVRVQPFGPVPFNVTVAYEGRSGSASGPVTTLSQTVAVTA